MNRRKFIKKILEREPRFECSSSIFYGSQYEFIVSGYLCEFVPSGIYIWEFVYPLFDKFDVFHLGYSKRIARKNSSIDTSALDLDVVVDEFFNRIEINDELFKEKDLNWFIATVITRDEYASDPNLLASLGMAYLLNGDRQRSESYLRNALVAGFRWDSFNNDTLLKQIQVEPTEVVETLKENVEDMRNLLLRLHL